MDPSTLLELLQRTDDEAAIYHFQILEQLNEALLRAVDFGIVEKYPPSDFLPALCKILKRPVHILAETPVLCCRAIKQFLKIDQSRQSLRVVLSQNIIGAYVGGLDVNGNDQTSKDLAEECIKTLEIFSKTFPSKLHKEKALEPVLAFKDLCVGLFPADVKISALSIVSSICGCMNPFGDPNQFLHLLTSLVNELKNTQMNGGKDVNKIRESCLTSLSLLCDRGCFSIPQYDSQIFVKMRAELFPILLPMLTRSEDIQLRSQVAVLLSKFLSASEHVLRSMIQCNIIDIVDQSLGGMGSGTPIRGVGTTEHEVIVKATLLRPTFFQVQGEQARN